jgi:hypothetical protein
MMKKIIKIQKADLNKIVQKRFNFTGINEYLRRRHGIKENYTNKHGIAKKLLEEEFSANNDLPLRELYTARAFYKNHLEDMFNINYTYDLWEKKHKYGLVNAENEPIMLKTDSEGYTLGLDMVPGETESLFAVDFVTSAFSNFRNFYNNKAALGNISTKNTSLPRIEAKKAWSPINDGYADHVQDLYEIFVAYTHSTDYIKEIDSFDSFIPIYLDFIGLVAKEAPFTKQAYAKSSLNSHYSSGLLIDLKNNYSFSDDVEKISFIKDKNFQKYQKIAQSFGFRIDRNAPWRIIANLQSPYMQQRMNSRGATYVGDSNYTDVFKKYYKRIDVSSYNRYIAIAIKFYNLLARTIPSSQLLSPIDENKIARSGPSGKANTTINVDREIVPISYIEKKYDHFFWLDSYFRIRLQEERMTIDENQIYHKVREAHLLKNSIDIKAALRYLNKEMKLLREYSREKNLSKDRCI